MRRQRCSTKRMTTFLKAEGLDHPSDSPLLPGLVELEFVTYTASGEEGV